MSRTIAHLDSLLNDWANSVPDYRTFAIHTSLTTGHNDLFLVTVRWDSTHDDDVFLSQSAHLHLQYRSVQIMIHRPSIAARGLKPLPPLSLAVCTSAARSIARVAETLSKREQQQMCALDTSMWAVRHALLHRAHSLMNFSWQCLQLCIYWGSLMPD